MNTENTRTPLMLRHSRLFRNLLLLGIFLAALAIPREDKNNEQPTYWRDAKPILEAHCVACHTAEAIGGFSLATYADALEAAPAIGEAVLAGYMPPWPPGGDTPPLIGERALTEAEINTLARWVMTGAEGNPAEYDRLGIAPKAPAHEIRADLALEMPAAYTPDKTASDDYRCFLIDPQLARDRYITGYTIEPGTPDAVHHVLLFQIPASAREQATRLDARDTAPGWPCFGGTGLTVGRGGGFGQSRLTNGASIAGSIGGWGPGSQPTFFPAGTGNLLNADSLIVMQAHYNLEAGAKPDLTRAILELADPDEALIALGVINLFAPVEIPCPTDMDSPYCERDIVLSEITAVEGPWPLLFNQGLLLLCDKTLKVYRNQQAENALGSCEREVPVDSFAVGVAGHMHELGKSIKIEQERGSGEHQMLLDIPHWDFHWQGIYQYAQPIPLAKGDILRITCVWDNSEGERYVVWGEGTKDEMCLGGVTILPLPEGITHEEFILAHPETFPEGALHSPPPK